MKKLIILLSVICLGAFLRLYQLGQIPPSPDWDEVALGYNAYSILKTGMDEYGTRFPLVLRSYDDYKPPLYMYIAIPFVAIFGLEVWAVRLPSVLFGISAILGTYLMVKEIFQNKSSIINIQIPNNNQFSIKNKQKKTTQSLFSYAKFRIVWLLDIKYWLFSEKIALLSAFFLSISPWHLNFSRIAFEANIGVALNIWGIYFFLKAREKPLLYIFSTIIFGLALYAYHSERVFVPLIVLFLLVSQQKQILTNKKIAIISIITACLFVLPLFAILLNPANMSRFSGTSVFADQTEVLKKSVRKLEEDKKNGNYLGMIFDNRRIVYGMKIAEGYLMHFSPKWLFLTSDQERHHAPGMGNLYVFEAPLIIIGMLWLIKRNTWEAKFLLFWFLIAPIPASPTSGVPHTIRSLVFLPTFQIFSALGVLVCIEYVSKYRNIFRKAIFGAYLFFSAVFFVQYIDLYFRHLNHEFSFAWQYGYKEAVFFAETNKQKYSKIVVSTALEQPHMFFLFYTKYDPEIYLREGGTQSGGFEEYRNRFDVYEFRAINWDKELHDGTILYIGTPREIKTEPQHKIQYLDGKDAIYIAQ